MVFASRSTWLAVPFAAFAVVGCSSSPDESVAAVSEPLTTPASLCGKAALTTIDDIPAYPNDCGNVNVWSNDGRLTQKVAGTGAGWVQTEGGYGYQCTELAVRYTHFLFGTSPHWGIAEAKDMCGTHPTDLTKTSSPVHGDLMVFTANDCVGAAGHVAVVSSVSGKTVSVVQQNEGSTGKGTYNESCAACFLHAARNNACGDKGNGAYCGDTSGFTGGTKGTLYVCDGYAVKSSTACEYGCDATAEVNACSAAPSDAGSDANADDDSASHDRTLPSNDGLTSSALTSSGGGCAVAAPSRAFDPRVAIFFGLALAARARRRRSA